MIFAAGAVRFQQNRTAAKADLNNQVSHSIPVQVRGYNLGDWPIYCVRQLYRRLNVPSPLPDRLSRLSPLQLRRQYRDIFGEDAHASSSQHLLRKLAWELQARIEGRLPDAALELALTI